MSFNKTGVCGGVAHRGEEFVGEVGVFCQDVGCQVKVLRERNRLDLTDINAILIKDSHLSSALCVFSSFHGDSHHMTPNPSTNIVTPSADPHWGTGWWKNVDTVPCVPQGVCEGEHNNSLYNEDLFSLSCLN